jgi:hypothetical protein
MKDEQEQPFMACAFVHLSSFLVHLSRTWGDRSGAVSAECPELGRTPVIDTFSDLPLRCRSFHQPGTIIGKALEPLASGKGEILVLLSLQ